MRQEILILKHPDLAFTGSYFESRALETDKERRRLAAHQPEGHFIFHLDCETAAAAPECSHAVGFS